MHIFTSLLLVSTFRLEGFIPISYHSYYRFHILRVLQELQLVVCGRKANLDPGDKITDVVRTEDRVVALLKLRPWEGSVRNRGSQAV